MLEVGAWSFFPSRDSTNILTAIMGRTACRRPQLPPVRGCVADQPQQHVPDQKTSISPRPSSVNLPPLCACVRGQPRFFKNVFEKNEPTAMPYCSAMLIPDERLTGGRPLLSPNFHLLSSIFYLLIFNSQLLISAMDAIDVSRHDFAFTNDARNDFKY